MTLQVPVSWGELLDKITILEIKRERIADPVKRENVARELHLLRDVRDSHRQAMPELDGLVVALRAANERLWDIEDAIRRCEDQGEFGATFIKLARSVYQTNDERAALKYRINRLLGSDIVEEKSYEPYQHRD